ncbi:MAG: PRC-barrel domain-containing protein [Ferruginibacter sp.]
MEKLPEENFTKDIHDGEQLNKPFKYLAASSIIGDKVHDANDAHMGDIKDFMMDLSTGKIEYYVIEFGGFLGIGTKYFAIPGNLLHVNPEKKIFVYTGEKEKLEKAPGFNQWHWPETNFHLVDDYWHFA